MRKYLLTITITLFLGCSLGPGKVAVSPGDTLQESVEAVNRMNPIGSFQARLDSIISLFQFGDMDDFLVAKDSLRFDIMNYLNTTPSARSDSQIIHLSSELDRLDSLSISEEYRHLYSSEIDSLALSLMPWPEINGTQVDTMPPLPGDTLFPRIKNKRIDFWIHYYTGPGRKLFSRALFRMERYRRTIEAILEELGLPRELVYIPLIESGFNLKARSRAKAVGPWQFIAGTGRIYGLRVNWWIDERRDIVASTYAAGNYLRDLYSVWEDWFLALSAYNAGEFRVARAIVRQKTEDFWKLKLPRQTQRYVPKFLAALYISREPEKYGFRVPKVEPLEFDAVTVKDATDIKLIARLCDSDIEVIRELNPAMLRWCTPPRAEVSIKVPKNKGENCLQKLNEVPVEKRVTWRKHRIRKGETLSQIARKYRTTVLTLKRLNGIRNSHFIRAGHTLIVPLKGAYVELASTKPGYRNRRRKINKKTLEAIAKKNAPPAGYKKIIYMVKDHDTLGEIAELFDTRASKLRRWNSLSFHSYIYPGQKLKVYVPKNFSTPKITTLYAECKPSADAYIKKTYVVKRGDTVYAISKRFNVSIVDLLDWNKKSARAKIFPGEKLDIWQKKN